MEVTAVQLAPGLLVTLMRLNAVASSYLVERISS